MAVGICVTVGRAVADGWVVEVGASSGLPAEQDETMAMIVIAAISTEAVRNGLFTYVLSGLFICGLAFDIIY